MLQQQIIDDMKTALKAGDKDKLAPLRMLKAALDYEKIAQGNDLTEEQVVAVVQRQIKQRKESVQMFTDGGSTEAAEREAAEAKTLERYLPQQLDTSEIESAVVGAIEATGAVGMADLGKVMGKLKGQLAGKADMQQVVTLVKQRLGQGA